MFGDTDGQLIKDYTKPNNIEKLKIHYLTTTSEAKNPRDFIQYRKHMMAISKYEKTALTTLEQNNCPLWQELMYARIRAFNAAHCNLINITLNEFLIGVTKLRDK